MRPPNHFRCGDARPGGSGSRVLVPLRIEPARQAREMSDAAVSARQAGAQTEGSAEFRKAIDQAPVEFRDDLARLAGWAEVLEGQGLARRGHLFTSQESDVWPSAKCRVDHSRLHGGRTMALRRDIRLARTTGCSDGSATVRAKRAHQDGHGEARRLVCTSRVSGWKTSTVSQATGMLT
jgi:hypothetical protein